MEILIALGLALLPGLLIYLLVRKASWVSFLRRYGLLERGSRWCQPITKNTCSAECLYYGTLLDKPWGYAYKCKACELKIQRFDKVNNPSLIRKLSCLTS